MSKPKTKKRYFWIIIWKSDNCGTGDPKFGSWERPGSIAFGDVIHYPSKKMALDAIASPLYDDIHAIPVRCRYEEPQIGGEGTVPIPMCRGWKSR